MIYRERKIQQREGRANREKETKQRKRPEKVPYLIGVLKRMEKERASRTRGRGSAA